MVEQLILQVGKSNSMKKLFGGIGIDVSEHHVRLVEVNHFGQIKSKVEIELPEGLVKDEQVIDVEAVAKEIQKIVERKGIRAQRGVLLLPESRVFSTSFRLSVDIKKDELEEEARLLAQKEIPIPLSQTMISVSKGGQNQDGIRTTLYAVEQEVYKGFVELLKETPIQLVAVEANTKGVHRLIMKHAQDSLKEKDKRSREKQEMEELVMLVVEIGHTWSTLSVYTPKGANLYSRSISYQNLGKSVLENGELSKEIVEILLEAINDLVVYLSQQDVCLAKIYLSGVEALDKQFVSSMETQFKQKVETVWIRDIFTLLSLEKESIHQFAPAIGAAIRAARPHQYAYQHNFLS